MLYGSGEMSWENRELSWQLVKLSWQSEKLSWPGRAVMGKSGIVMAIRKTVMARSNCHGNPKNYHGPDTIPPSPHKKELPTLKRVSSSFCD
ncbi:hypothetical protein AB1K83_00775 [Sporosarcina sp. 179-K 3D1 HS]|uniref:hypothetical protein n=1 Tax=Sporosarcina sp. 179-K 3D1 HS TaxID=3232169 RepID=UPI0039A01CC0